MKNSYRERTDINRQSYLGVSTHLIIFFTLALSLSTIAAAAESAPNTAVPAIKTGPGMPPVIDPNNLYSETQAGKLSPAASGALPVCMCPTDSRMT